MDKFRTHGATIVVKIGGSTLGSDDTTLEDLVGLQQNGIKPVVVHGGGKTITEWMVKQGVKPKFVGGLRVTDLPSLKIVVAVLTGLINKTLVSSIQSMGGQAIGLSGVDNSMIQAKIKETDLGLVGKIVRVNTNPINAVLEAGCIPLIAPVALHISAGPNQGEMLLNVNADTAAGEIAAALKADRLMFLTDVDGVLDSSRHLIPRITQHEAKRLIRSNLVGGGMLPKLEACLIALKECSEARILDGRKPRALLNAVAGREIGTIVC